MSVAGAGRYSGQGRRGHTAAQATDWASDTSVVCMVAGGVGGSLTLAMTAGALGGSETVGTSYDAGGLSGVSAANAKATGGASMSVRGSGFGASR